ncbi:MAG: hypothetical protein ACYTG6_10385 [Planctomycetota bacterium]|jgi:hypothetical protein
MSEINEKAKHVRLVSFVVVVASGLLFAVVDGASEIEGTVVSKDLRTLSELSKVFDAAEAARNDAAAEPRLVTEAARLIKQRLLGEHADERARLENAALAVSFPVPALRYGRLTGTEKQILLPTGPHAALSRAPAQEDEETLWRIEHTALEFGRGSHPLTLPEVRTLWNLLREPVVFILPRADECEDVDLRVWDRSATAPLQQISGSDAEGNAPTYRLVRRRGAGRGRDVVHAYKSDSRSMSKERGGEVVVSTIELRVPVDRQEIDVQQWVAVQLGRERQWGRGAFEDAFPHLLAYFEDEYTGRDLRALEAVIQRKRDLQASQQSIEIAGVQVPLMSLRRFGTLVLTIVLIYLALHLHALVSARSSQLGKLDVPWIPLYPGWAPKLAFLFSIAVLPLIPLVIGTVRAVQRDGLAGLAMCGVAFLLSLGACIVMVLDAFRLWRSRKTPGAGRAADAPSIA